MNSVETYAPPESKYLRDMATFADMLIKPKEDPERRDLAFNCYLLSVLLAAYDIDGTTPLSRDRGVPRRTVDSNNGFVRESYFPSLPQVEVDANNAKLSALYIKGLQRALTEKGRDPDSIVLTDPEKLDWFRISRSVLRIKAPKTPHSPLHDQFLDLSKFLEGELIFVRPLTLRSAA